MSANEFDSGLRSVDRVCDILDLLATTKEGATLRVIAESCGLAKGSTHRYLQALEFRRYVERSPNRATYHLGRALFALPAGHLEDLTERSRPFLEMLKTEYGQTANLGLRDGDHVVYLTIVESSASMRLASRPGDREDLHCSALGKALLATLSESELEAIVSRVGMTARTKHTITNRNWSGVAG